MKNKLLTLGSLVVAVAPITIAVSCGGGEENKFLNFEEKCDSLFKEKDRINFYNSGINLLLSKQHSLENPTPHMVTRHRSTFNEEQRLRERASSQGVSEIQLRL